MPRQALLAVLFADICGSSLLYETLGDARATRVVAACMALMAETGRVRGGTLVKTIGDGVVATFDSADDAAAAACALQESVAGRTIEACAIALRVGFHFGPTLVEATDVYGDAVNLAARMVEQAKPGQILTTGATAGLLSGPLAVSCRRIDVARVKGRREPVAIHELLARTEDATWMRAPWQEPPATPARLVLTAGETSLALDATRPGLAIGRAPQNHLIVPQPASRLHARIDFHNGRFVLTDLSVNGTFVAVDGGRSLLVHRDSVDLSGAGALGFGEAAVSARYSVG